MARRKKGDPVNGWLILDKPLGMTSTQAVAFAKRIFNAQKAGHAGTLDPLATGILPIALGEATKTVSYAVDGAKAYSFTVQWGVETTTDDAEGPAVRTSDLRPTRAAIEALLPQFTGVVSQVPPQFSAVKIDGERAYDLARDGEVVVLEPRSVQIDRLAVVAMPDEATTVFEAECGKGTYVRALARDIGRALSCFGHVVALRRTRVGHFGEEQAVTCDDLEREQAADGIAPLPRLLPTHAALMDLQTVAVQSADASRLRQGQSVLLRGRDAPLLTGPFIAISKGQLIAIGEADRGELKPVRVFNGQV
jgi:tRNA pseudouridine55 synthase